MTGRSFDVLLSDRVVGLLSESAEGRIAFRFSDPYRRDPQRGVLSQSFEDDLERTYVGKAPGQLPAFFSNLLPEGRFREILEQNLGVQTGDDLGLLAAACDDLPGALGLRPTTEALVLGAIETAGESRGEREDAPGLRFSLAGVQLKFSMLRGTGRLTLPAHGQHGDWIVKVGTPEYPGLAENEYSIMEWARAGGFDVPDCELLTRDDVPQISRHVALGARVFAVRRFDRAGDRRLHQEDFMQVFGWPAERARKYGATYDALARTTQALLGESGCLELVRRLVLVIASANNDAHLKNWALLYGQPTRPQLAPVYDQVATVAWPQLDRRLAFKLAGVRAWPQVDLDSFGRLASRAGADPARTLAVVRETLARLLDAWRRRGAAWPLWPEHR